MRTGILPNMIPMRDIKEVSDGDRVFFELGFKFDFTKGYGDNWIRRGVFEEIEDIKDWLEVDTFLTDIE
jgi:hypothetical protein